MNKIGLKLKSIRKQKGFPQKAIAGALQMDRSGYSRVENDLQKITPEQIKLFCEFCKVSADYVLDINTNQTKPFSKSELEEIIKRQEEIISLLHKKIPKD